MRGKESLMTPQPRSRTDYSRLKFIPVISDAFPNFAPSSKILYLSITSSKARILARKPRLDDDFMTPASHGFLEGEGRGAGLGR